jgi:hypothetical protein
VTGNVRFDEHSRLYAGGQRSQQRGVTCLHVQMSEGQ